MRSLVTRVSVATRLAVEKLGRFVLGQFVRCELFRWNMRAVKTGVHLQ